MQYRTKHVATLFNITPQTVSVWAREFAEYLSLTATPGEKKQRLFSQQDMEVLALVSELQKRGMTFAEIHANLKSGQRGQPPAIDPNEVQAIISSSAESRLALENERMKQALIEAHNALKKAQEELHQLEVVKSEKLRLEVQLEADQRHHQIERERLEATISHLMKRIEDLAERAGREYSRGYTEAMREKGSLPPKE